MGSGLKLIVGEHARGEPMIQTGFTAVRLIESNTPNIADLHLSAQLDTVTKLKML